MSLTREDRGHVVSIAESEALLAAVAARVENPAAGVYGPDSLTWRVNREAAIFLGAGRAAILQLAHPWVTAALAQHSSVLARPIARFHNTFRIVFTMVFGALEQALGAARYLHRLHTRIQGEMTEDAAAYSRGSRYQANEIAALRWVYATLAESAVVAYEAVAGPLSAQEREAYYAESKTLAALFGLPPSALPEDWSAFENYCREMCASNALGASDAARAMARDLLAGAGSWIRPPYWYRATTALWLPERIRAEFGLRPDEGDRKKAERALQRIAKMIPRLPGAIRFVGPYHEAQARLSGEPAGVLARMSNRFWIGEAKLPFA